MSRLKMGLPSGSLQESTISLFARAGYKIRVSPRSYTPSIDDPELEGLLLRAQEMARYVERGVLDVGLTGLDWIQENDADVVEIAELAYSKTTAMPARWVVAVPEDSPIKTVSDLNGKRIATELVNVTQKWLASKGVEAEVEYSFGSTEAKVKQEGMVHAIVEITETGSSIRANKLRIVDTMMQTTTRFIMNKQAWDNPWKREKTKRIANLLVGAFQAEDKVGLKMNLRRDNVDKVVGQLPALNNPTISNLLDDEWVAIEVIVDESTVRDIIPNLLDAGAEGIIEYPLNKVIY
ncbi:ATP phosphoribosyltransferase [bacterium]|jgi:ATP phosphoribosyltransferase|nr:ATP phosphoribosyltransferase [Gemmatimonadota bacterium]MCH2664857.1 ATP phosphoribosyltransferase [bacterium]HCK09250.1 ATP phosphoribosyltransferase [Candidatus Latescibacterota bacterium]